MKQTNKSRIDKREYKFFSDQRVKIWHKNNNYHRDRDLPAIIWSTGLKSHYKNGCLIIREYS